MRGGMISKSDGWLTRMQNWHASKLHRKHQKCQSLLPPRQLARPRCISESVQKNISLCGYVYQLAANLPTWDRTSCAWFPKKERQWFRCWHVAEKTLQRANLQFEARWKVQATLLWLQLSFGGPQHQLQPAWRQQVLAVLAQTCWLNYENSAANFLLFSWFRNWLSWLIVVGVQHHGFSANCWLRLRLQSIPVVNEQQ